MAEIHYAMLREGLRRIHPNSFCVKLYGDGHQEVGLPDFFVIVNGRAIGLEVKVQPDKPREGQAMQLERISNAGGLGAFLKFYKDGTVTIQIDDFQNFTWKKGVSPEIQLQKIIGLTQTGRAIEFLDMTTIHTVKRSSR